MYTFGCDSDNSIPQHPIIVLPAAMSSNCTAIDSTTTTMIEDPVDSMFARYRDYCVPAPMEISNPALKEQLEVPNQEQSEPGLHIYLYRRGSTSELCTTQVVFEEEKTS